jgi:hypothetical protein
MFIWLDGSVEIEMMVIASILFLPLTPIGVVSIVSIFLPVNIYKNDDYCIDFISSVNTYKNDGYCIDFMSSVYTDRSKVKLSKLMQYAFSAPNEIYLHQSI